MRTGRATSSAQRTCDFTGNPRRDEDCPHAPTGKFGLNSVAPLPLPGLGRASFRLNPRYRSVTTNRQAPIRAVSPRHIVGGFTMPMSGNKLCSRHAKVLLIRGGAAVGRGRGSCTWCPGRIPERGARPLEQRQCHDALAKAFFARIIRPPGEAPGT